MSHSSDDNSAYEPEIQYGIHRSRRSTSYEYRDSSSLAPAERMEQETYYNAAEISLERSFLVMHVVCVMNALYQYFARLLQHYLLVMNGTDAIIITIRQKMDDLKKSIQYLLLLVSFIKAHGELALLYAEDLTVFVRGRNRFKPKRFRSLADISRRDSYLWFGLTPEKLGTLYHHWRVPDEFRSASRHVFSGEECFIIFMYHLCKGVPFTVMAQDHFGGDPRDFSKMVELMIDYLYDTCYNKISGTSLDQWLPVYLDNCRQFIFDALGNGAIWEVQYDGNGDIIDENWIFHHFEYDSIHIFGFLDDMACQTSRPGTSARLLLNLDK
jgi:hypothetical protein